MAIMFRRGFIAICGAIRLGHSNCDLTLPDQNDLAYFRGSLIRALKPSEVVLDENGDMYSVTFHIIELEDSVEIVTSKTLVFSYSLWANEDDTITTEVISKKEYFKRKLAGEFE